MNKLATLAFYASLGKGVIHSFSHDRATVNAVRSLERNGFLIVRWSSRQAEFSGKCFANRA